jgi:hypothetical protein
MAQCSRPVGAVLSSAALVAATAVTLAAHSTMPEAGAAPSTTPTTTSGAASESDAGSGSDYPSDEYGFLDSAARCDDSQVLMSFGRTSRALVAICVDPDGDLEYRGVRLSDETSLTAPAGRASGGSVVATNNGVTYAVSPEMLLVSEGDTVLYRDSWLEFRQPRFSGEPGSSTTPTSTPTTTPTSAEAPITTVSTTTVTVTPDSNSGY